MEVESKLARFQKTPEAIKRYRRLMLELRELGIDAMLQELAFPDPVDLTSPQAGNMAIASLHENLGYQRCLAQLFNLDGVSTMRPDRLVADFGANEKLGVSEEEARKFNEG